MSHAGEVVVYSRPRCTYCMRLRFGLRRRRVRYREVNISEDPQAAASVRAVANGIETVPTVVVGNRWLVNPSAGEVVVALEASAF